MAQPSIAEFFNTRKRATADNISNLKNKNLLDSTQETISTSQQNDRATPTRELRSRTPRTVKRTGLQNAESVPKKLSKTEQKSKIALFIQKGQQKEKKSIALTEFSTPSTKDTILPMQLEMQKQNEETPSTSKKESELLGGSQPTNAELGLKTPTKQIIKGSGPIKHGEIKSLVRKELNFDEVKTKLTRSAKLSELKASLNRIQELEKKRKAQEEKNQRLRDGLEATPTKAAQILTLKQFDTIEVEILASPSKTFKTPTKKVPPTPDKNELMSPRHTDVSKRVLFSPAKNGSPSKMIVPPAYQRFMSLVETSKAGQLPLPFKYRTLIQIFKGLDSVCAMYFNRKECITFKKLKPAVQRMLRKNFTEAHLAQIKHLYPEAFLFSQMKMRNYGSASKADYFQLVVTPNVDNVPENLKMNKIDEDNVLAAAQSNAMNPHVMTERLQRFQSILLGRVLDEHDKFLKTLDPPLSIPKMKVTRWHPDFDLESCSDIELGNLPQPPNVEKYSSARDILSTARNLFNCTTPMERVMERYEAKMQETRIAAENLKNTKMEITAKESGAAPNLTTATPTTDLAASLKPIAPTSNNPSDPASTLLKGIPQSLLEKIRAKQAAKALDAMTRRPSQDQEATKYSRLPELAKHLRNVYVTEHKAVLPLELVIKKIENSFRTSLTPQDIESHLKILAKEMPTWVAFLEVRKTMYVKISRDMDLAKIIKKLEVLANEKAK